MGAAVIPCPLLHGGLIRGEAVRDPSTLHRERIPRFHFNTNCFSFAPLVLGTDSVVKVYRGGRWDVRRSESESERTLSPCLVLSGFFYLRKELRSWSIPIPLVRHGI